MKIRFKKDHPDAVSPKYALEGDACADLYAVSVDCDEYNNIIYDTGISLEIPAGFVGLLFPRSSISKTSMILANSVGVIDSGYRGTIKLKFKSVGESLEIYKKQDRVGQIMIVPRPNIEFQESNELSLTSRGAGGFGSTGT